MTDEARTDPHERFLKLFLGNQGDLRAFIYSVVRDRHACEDVLQETALVLWQEFARYDPTRPFGAWARGIAANKVMQSWAKAKRVPLALSPEAIQSVVDACDRHETDVGLEQEALRHCMEGLPDKSRRLLELRYDKAFKLHEMARFVNSTLDAVHKALSRIRTHLEKCVELRLAAAQRGEAARG